MVPGFVDEAFQVVAGAPAEQEFCFGIIEPGGEVGCFDLDGRHCSRFAQVVGDLQIVDRFIHTNVEGLLVGFWVIEGDEDAVDQVGDVDEIAFYGFAGGIEHQGDGVALGVFVGVFWADEGAPVRAAEDVFAEGQRKFEVVFLHDPWGTETTAVETVLNVVLLEHDFFQDFGEGVAAGVGGVFLLLGDGKRVRVEEVADGAVAADQDELAEGLAGAGFYEEPKEAFDGDVDDVVGSFFACGAVDDVSDVFHGAADYVAVGDVAGDDFQAVVECERAIVAEGADGDVGEVVVGEDVMDEIGADFAGSAGDEDAFHEG